MQFAPFPRVEVDRRPPTAEQLQHRALVNYGHFTAMQVRDRKVRGLHLHLHRLDAATEEVFGANLDASRIREHIRRALGEKLPDASVRVDVFRPGPDSVPSVMVSVSQAVGMPSLLQRLQSVPYRRRPHMKHVGMFGQIYYGHVADGNGYDEASLTSGSDPVVWEGATTNIGFFDGRRSTGRIRTCCAGSPCSCCRSG